MLLLKHVPVASLIVWCIGSAMKWSEATCAQEHLIQASAGVNVTGSVAWCRCHQCTSPRMQYSAQCQAAHIAHIRFQSFTGLGFQKERIEREENSEIHVVLAINSASTQHTTALCCASSIESKALSQKRVHTFLYIKNRAVTMQTQRCILANAPQSKAESIIRQERSLATLYTWS